MKNFDKQILELVNSANRNKKAKVELGKLTIKQVIDIKNQTNYNTTGYTRIIDSYAIRHIFKSHPNIKITDILLIPFIIKNYDFIGQGKEHNTIVYKKLIGKEYFYIEEIRTGKKNLALKTLYKRKQRKVKKKRKP